MKDSSNSSEYYYKRTAYLCEDIIVGDGECSQKSKGQTKNTHQENTVIGSQDQDGGGIGCEAHLLLQTHHTHTHTTTQRTIHTEHLLDSDRRTQTSKTVKKYPHNWVEQKE